MVKKPAIETITTVLNVYMCYNSYGYFYYIHKVTHFLINFKQ